MNLPGRYFKAATITVLKDLTEKMFPKGEATNFSSPICTKHLQTGKCLKMFKVYKNYRKLHNSYFIILFGLFLLVLKSFIQIKARQFDQLI